jgi:hypothetical protein
MIRSGKLLAGAGLLTALNIWLCWPLYRTDYLDQLQSNEGSFIALGKFLLNYWPHVRWFPWFNCGMPYEATYLPLVPAMVAIGARLTGWPAPQVFHLTAALAYSLAPGFLLLFAWKLSKSFAPSFFAALLWSLFSCSAVLPDVRADMGTVFGLRRLQTVVFYGEVPHNVAVCLLPLALMAVHRYLESPRARTFAMAVLGISSVMLSNAFGVVVVALSSLILVAVYDRQSWKSSPKVGTLLAVSYLLICRLCPPSVLSAIFRNSQQVSGDYRFTLGRLMLAAFFVAVLAALSRIVIRLRSLMLRFALLFLACFGGITVLAKSHFSFLPQPSRYHLEMEIGMCLAAAFAMPLLPMCRPSRGRRPVLAIAAALAIVLLARADRRYAASLVRAVSVERDVRIREARWIGAHLPGQRVMASGEEGFWLDDFTENPQLSGGHDPSAPNWVQRVAVYTIYSGENAGDQDGPISVLWLKAFGADAVTVAGPGSKDYDHPIRNPRKFDSLLPLMWSEGDDSVYQLGSPTSSLVHVIPSSAIVSQRPRDGLDTGELKRYVGALEGEHLPGASLTWLNPEWAQVMASLVPGEVLSVQVTYDADWRAKANGHSVPVRSDQLGMMIVAPACAGACRVDLEFTEGMERGTCDMVSGAVALLILGMLLRGPRQR